MLKLTIRFDSEVHEIEFEHSLLSVSKWESRTKKSFFQNINQDPKELLEYFADMITTPGIDPDLVYVMTPDQMLKLEAYLTEEPTASSVPKSDRPSPNREVITSELIYYWIVQLKIPFTVETWNIYRLFKLIEITNFKQQPQKKVSQAEALAKWREANVKRKEQYNTKG